ncbi:MAG: zinc ABC transporter substrate-binding protein [Clostridia bacterium]|nr:zinc ABC transporter substrate-binding protein [Clostridia bacterium]
MKKLIIKASAFLVALCLMLAPLCGCSRWWEDDRDKPLIVATLFPQYDFARNIVGDKFDVVLLLPPGAESHSYDPTAADIAGILSCDIFLYTGALEPWADTILDGSGKDIFAVDLSEGIELLCGDDHGEEHEHEHHHEEGDILAHSHDYDAHIWTSPANCITMTESILEAVCAVDSENEALYRENARLYIEQLTQLDSELMVLTQGAQRHDIVMSGRFALGYFAERYGLHPRAAFDSCSHEAEPSVRTIADIITYMEENDIPVIYYEELCDPKTANAIAEATGAKALLLHSCHNLSKEETERGEDYLSLMRQNIENLKEGLN